MKSSLDPQWAAASPNRTLWQFLALTTSLRPRGARPRPKLAPSRTRKCLGLSKHEANTGDTVALSRLGSHCTFAACGVTPSDKHKQATYTTSQSSSGGPEPCGDSCAACQKRWQSGFGFWTWELYCEHAQTESGRHHIAQLDDIDSGIAPDWVPDAVTSDQSTQITLQRSVIVMTPQEYRRELQVAPPGSRGPRLPTLRLPLENGKGDVDHLVFMDP